MPTLEGITTFAAGKALTSLFGGGGGGDASAQAEDD